MVIELSDPEIKICEWLAKKRYSSNRRENVDDKKIGPQSCEETDIEGLCGEMAFCKAINLYPDFSVAPRRGGCDSYLRNGESIDIKTTHYTKGRLVAKLSKNKNDSDIYVLVVGKRPSYRICGWAYSEELINDNAIINLGYGPTFGLEQAKLKPIHDLLLKIQNPESQ